MIAAEKAMMLSLVDREGHSTIATTEGQVALMKGDTARARQKFEEAGNILLANIGNTRKQPEKHLLRFLAATQYFKGGLYQKALDLCAKIQVKLLQPQYRSLFSRFVQDTKARAHPEYEKRIRQQLLALWKQDQPKQIIELLQEHPYVLRPEILAFLRAAACERLRDYRAAALCYAAALRFSPGNTMILAGMVALPLRLAKQGQLEEAWTYVLHLLELVPHPVTSALASILCFHRATTALAEEQPRLLEEQARYFDEAWQGYQQLPAIEHNNPDLRSCIVGSPR